MYSTNTKTYYPYNNMMYQDDNNIQYAVDDRGFIVPFILGGLTGGLIAPAFYRPNYYNNYSYQQPYYYRPYPYYW